jgi:hypothetical protein
LSGTFLFYLYSWNDLPATSKLIIFAVMADPEPDDILAIFDSDRAVVNAYPRRPVFIHLFEVKRWVARVLFQTRVRLIGELLDLRW